MPNCIYNYMLAYCARIKDKEGRREQVRRILKKERWEVGKLGEDETKELRRKEGVLVSKPGLL